MNNLGMLRDFMKSQALSAREKKSVHVTGESLQDALTQAALELGTRISDLEYEVMEKGKKKILGRGGSNWLLLVYRKEIKETAIFSESEVDIADEDYEKTFEQENQDGKVFVHLKSDGAYLKVIEEYGKGSPASMDDAIAKLHSRAVHEIDEKIIKTCLKEKKNEWVRVGDFIYNPSSDGMMTVEIDPDEMTASLIVTGAGPGGADIDEDDILHFLERNGVCFGIDEKRMENFVNEPVYMEPYVVAKGLPAKNGADARIIYLFEVDNSKIRLRESDGGKVNFKELNQIQNVVEGEPLAKKVPPEPGKDGETVTGRMLAAKDGSDIEFGLGKNVVLADNGKMVKAGSSGQVLLLNNKITVETVMIIPGDVSTGSGSVSGLGTVIIKGNVQDGFTVTAQANIEIYGFVGNAVLEAGGDIIIHKGVNGGGIETDDKENPGRIKSGQSIWAKFITNAIVIARENVVVSDGIVNSSVIANKKIICRGKRAKIVGGITRAAEEINASSLGSVGGVITALEVGYDPEAKEQLTILEEKQNIIEKKLSDVERNLQGLMHQKKLRKKLTEEKEGFLLKYKNEHNQLKTDLMKILKEVKKDNDYLDGLKLKGKISASGDIHPGVEISIKDAHESINKQYRATTFIQEGGFIKSRPYEDIDESLIRR